MNDYELITWVNAEIIRLEEVIAESVKDKDNLVRIREVLWEGSK